jgi:hypothetical protein
VESEKMPDEPQVEPTETTETPQEQPAPESPSNYREEPGFKAVVNQVNELREQLETYKAKEAKEAEKEALARGEHERVIEQLKADKKAIQQEHETFKRTSSLENKLALAGATNPVFIKGAIAGLEKDADIDEYVASLVESNAEWFGGATKSAHPTLTPPSVNPAPHNGPKTDTTDDLLAKGDKETRMKILKEIMGK